MRKAVASAGGSSRGHNGERWFGECATAILVRFLRILQHDTNVSCGVFPYSNFFNLRLFIACPLFSYSCFMQIASSLSLNHRNSRVIVGLTRHETNPLHKVWQSRFVGKSELEGGDFGGGGVTEQQPSW